MEQTQHDDFLSQFRIISMGVALENLIVENILTDNPQGIIEVGPIEQAPGMTGELKSNPEVIETKGVDSSGKEYSAKTITNTCWSEVKWLPWGSNRLTPPNIRRGERVLIWQFADDDTQVYWTPTGLDEHLRRLETVVWGFNANPNKATKPGEGKDKRSPEDMWTLEISTHTKQITLRTTDRNGELTTFVCQFNPGDGSFNLIDAQGNQLSLDCIEGEWLLQNSYGSYIKVSKNMIEVFAEDLIKVMTRLFKLECDTLDINATDNILVNTLRFFMDSPDNTITGHLKVGNISSGVNGNNKGMVSEGDMEINGDNQTNGSNVTTGNMTVGGTLTVGGSINCNGLHSSSPISAPNI